MKKTITSVLACTTLLLGAQETSFAASAPFGFSGKEIFPIDPAISHLKAVDLDGDGLLDIVVANNARSKVSLLYNKTGKTAEVLRALAETPYELNELPPDARFQIESIASEKRIAGLVATDLNGDARPDIAYYGEPKELVIHYNEGDGKWSLPKRIPIRDGQVNANGLVQGDMNGDGKSDLILLADNYVYIIKQEENGELGEPEKVPFSDTVRGLQILDINGDGQQDVLQVNWESTYPIQFRIQGANGKLGPEIHFAMPSFRSYWADDLDADGKTELMTIATQSGRAQLANFTKKSSSPLVGDFRVGQFQTIPFERTSKAKRGVAWADLNHDQRVDLLVAEPDNGQLTLYLQSENGQLAEPRTFPSLAGISEIEVADWDGDGNPEIFLLSTAEQQVGVTRLEENSRIPFPRILPVSGRPLAISAGRIRPDADASLAVLNVVGSQRSLQILDAEGNIFSQDLDEDFRSNPASFTIHDANQDGIPDLVALIPYEKVKILVQKEGERKFDEIDVSAPGGNSEDPWMSLADLDGDGISEMLLAQGNFVRAVVLAKDDSRADADEDAIWSFQVKDQINGSSSSSKIIGATAIHRGDSETPYIFLLDQENKTLSVCELNENGVWTVDRNLEIPLSQFTQLRSVKLQSLSLGAEEPNHVAIVGVNAISMMALEGDVWAIEELAGYETAIRDGWLMDVVAGDLNEDGRKDLVFLEGLKNNLDIVEFNDAGEMNSSLRWQVFEKRTFRTQQNVTAEPREAVIADFTGDGKNDLAIIVHDRILLYPQE